MANTFRIRKLRPTSGSAGDPDLAAYEPQFSQDGGATWRPLSQIPTDSEVDAGNMIRNVLHAEASFNQKLAEGELVPEQTFIDFPRP